MPIIRHLALRRDPIAMLELSDEQPDAGRILAPSSQQGLAYRAYRLGAPLGAQHLAMNAFNRGDLTSYRHWLRRAANLGDADCLAELRRFETRLPHNNAFRIRRGRPVRRNVDYE